jgi:hypothetical protein
MTSEAVILPSLTVIRTCTTPYRVITSCPAYVWAVVDEPDDEPNDEPDDELDELDVSADEPAVVCPLEVAERVSAVTSPATEDLDVL